MESKVYFMDFYWMLTVHLHKNVNNNLQQMHFQYIYCVSARAGQASHQWLYFMT
jgi:hypothetical protein